MNRVVPVMQTEAVALRRFDHVPCEVHRDPPRERAGEYAVNFVESGSFRLRTSKAWQEVSSRTLFVTTPGLEFSCAHDEEHPRDRCLSVALAPDTVEAAKAVLTLSSAPVRPLTNRHAFLYRALSRCDAPDGVRVETVAGALLGALAVETSRAPLFRPDRLSWYAARVERAKSLMEAEYGEPLTLSRLARDAGMSLFHFARVFAELEGRPPHRFLTDVRLAQALARLQEGDTVTDTSLAVGFGSLSHFVTTFRRRYGVSPSRIHRRKV